MAFDNKVKRRPWTIEEKTSALKSCASRCACCGKKLTLKTLTMEHVVPISKGGENVLENLIVLCNECNSRKGNKFCWPRGYYTALNNTGKLNSIDKYTNNWVDKNITREHLEEYPMFSESITFFLKPKEMRYNIKNGAYIPSLLMDVSELNDDNCGKYIYDANLKRKDIYKSVPNPDKSFSLIAATKRSSGDCMALFTLQIDQDVMFINSIYSTSYKVDRAVAFGLIQTLCEVLIRFGVNIFIYRSHSEKAINTLLEGGLQMPLSHCRQPYDSFDYDGKEDSIYGRNQMALVTRTKQEDEMEDILSSVRKKMR